MRILVEELIKKPNSSICKSSMCMEILSPSRKTKETQSMNTISWLIFQTWGILITSSLMKKEERKSDNLTINSRLKIKPLSWRNSRLKKIKKRSRTKKKGKRKTLKCTYSMTSAPILSTLMTSKKYKKCKASNSKSKNSPPKSSKLLKPCKKKSSKKTKSNYFNLR